MKYHCVCEPGQSHIKSINYKSILDYIRITSPLNIPEIALLTEIALDSEIMLNFVVFAPIHEHVCSLDYT